MYLVWLTLQIVGLASQLTSGSHLVYPKALDSDIAGSGGLTTGMGASQLRGGERCLPQSPSCPP